ncbi:putative MFS transporter [Oxalobacteraceae bacterium GrIS 2.11]
MNTLINQHSIANIGARLDRLPTTRSVWKLIVLLSLGYFFELYDLLYTAYIVPGLVKSGVLSATTPGLFGTSGVASFIAALFAGLFIGTALAGFLADRFGRRPMFTWSLIWYTVANFIMAFQETAWGLNFWRLMVGIGIGAELIVIGAYLTELVPKEVRGRAFACGQAAGFTAVPVAAFLAYLLVPLQPLGIDGWRWVVLIGCHGALFVWWIRRELPESPRWLASKGRFAEANEVLLNLENKVRAESGQALGALPLLSEQPVKQGQFSDLWRAPYRGRTMLMIVFNVFQTIGYYGFASWVPTLLIQQGITVTSSLLYASLIALAAPVGPLIGLWIADKWERKHVIIVTSLCILVAGLLFSQASEMGLIVALGVCMTLASNMLSYTYHAYQAELFPTAVRARAVGFVYSWGRFAAIFSSFMIAAVLRVAGVTGVFWFIGCAMLIIAVAIYLFGPKTRNIAVESI